MSGIAERLRAARVAPVVRTSTEAAARRAVDLLAAEGFTLFEITFTTPGALAIVSDLAKRGDLLIGAGTILDRETAEAALGAGAQFLVSPVDVPGLVEVGHEAGCPVALGAATPGEAWRAHEAGADFVKLFPARQLGGPGFLKAVRSVFPQMTLMPTGGIEPGEIGDYLSAGAACLGMGGQLVSDAALQVGDDDTIRRAAREVRAAIEAAA